MNTCINCKFFKPEPVPWPGYTGTCRRNPPEVVALGHLDANVSPFPPAGKEDMWCGEHKKA